MCWRALTRRECIPRRGGTNPGVGGALQSIFVYSTWRRFPAPAESHVRAPDRHRGDPATGSAAAALAALLTSLAPGVNVDLHYDIEQGVEMGRTSQLIASARKTGEGPVLATVAGSCVSVMRGTLEV